MDSDSLYRLMAAQLQDDGFPGAALAIAKATLIPVPKPGEVPKNTLQRMLNNKGGQAGQGGPGGVGVLDLLDTGVNVSSYGADYPYGARWSAAHPGGAARFSVDGKLLAIGAADGSVRVLDAWSILHARNPDAGPTGPLQCSYSHDHSGRINDVAFHPNNRILVSASQARDTAHRCAAPCAVLGLTTAPPLAGLHNVLLRRRAQQQPRQPQVHAGVRAQQPLRRPAGVQPLPLAAASCALAP